MIRFATHRRRKIAREGGVGGGGVKAAYFFGNFFSFHMIDVMPKVRKKDSLSRFTVSKIFHTRQHLKQW